MSANPYSGGPDRKSTGLDDEKRDADGRGYSRGGLRSICSEYGIEWRGMTSAEMVFALDNHSPNVPVAENQQRKTSMATKMNLDRTFSYGGKHYGPGAGVLVEDKDAAEAIAAKIKALQEEAGGPKAGDASGAVSQAALPAEVQAKIDELEAKKAELEAQKSDLEQRLSAMGQAQNGNQNGNQNSNSVPLDSTVRERLSQAGYDSPEKLAAASDEDLLKVENIGPATIAKIRAMASS